VLLLLKLYIWIQEPSGQEETKKDGTGPKICSYVIKNYPFYMKNSLRGVEGGGGAPQRILKDISYVFSLSFGSL